MKNETKTIIGPDDKELKAIANSLKPPARVYRSAWRVRVGGNFVRLNSGKHLWSRHGDAVNALIYHVHNKSDFDGKLIAKALLDGGYVEIVEIPIDD
jgi:hypothetical protein